jgi:hypothetical protein
MLTRFGDEGWSGHGHRAIAVIRPHRCRAANRWHASRPRRPLHWSAEYAETGNRQAEPLVSGLRGGC